LTQDFISENESDPIASRQIIAAIFDVLCSNNKALSWDVFLNVTLLAISKGFLYLYDPYETDPTTMNRSWQRLIANDPVNKTGRLYSKQWAQWMMAELGAPDVLTCLAASSMPLVKLANLQFGISLLQGGNKLVQDAFVTSCVAVQSRQQGPIALIRSILKEMTEAKGELSRVLALPSRRGADVFENRTLSE
jgi:hypothetical protein